MSIRLRLFLGFVVVIALGVFLAIRGVVGLIGPHTYHATEASMAETAALLASVVEVRAAAADLRVEDLRAAMSAALERDLSASIQGVAKRTIDLRVYVTDAAGIVVYDSDGGRDEGRDYSRWNDVRRTLRGRYGARATRSNPDDPTTSVHYVAAPIRVGGRIVGVLSAGKPVEGLGALMVAMRQRVLWAGLAALVLATPLSLVLAYWIALPLQRLASYAAAVGAGARPTFPKLHGREVVALGRSVEDMRTALEGKAYVEGYVRSLTHEIKAPLSAIRASSELLTEDLPVEHRRRFLGHIRTEVGRLGSLVDRMLELAAVEARTGLVESERLAVRSLVSDVHLSIEPLAQVRGVALRVRDCDDGSVQGDGLLLRQALMNLVLNAVAASPEGACVELGCESDAQGGVVTFEVRDRGPGVPAYALPRVFERFFSVPLPGSTRRGTGLGLSFVREVAKLHGGSATLENRDGGGAVAQLRIPQRI